MHDPLQEIPTYRSLGHLHTPGGLFVRLLWAAKGSISSQSKPSESKAIIKVVLMVGGLLLTNNRPHATVHTCLNNVWFLVSSHTVSFGMDTFYANSSWRVIPDLEQKASTISPNG